MLEGLTPPITRLYPCKVTAVISELSEADKAILTEAIADTQSWPARSLSNALAERGLTLADTTIARHRKGQCQCGRGK